MYTLANERALAWPGWAKPWQEAAVGALAADGAAQCSAVVL